MIDDYMWINVLTFKQYMITDTPPSRATESGMSFHNCRKVVLLMPIYLLIRFACFKNYRKNTKININHKKSSKTSWAYL